MNTKVTKIVFRIVAVIIALILIAPLVLNLFSQALTTDEAKQRIEDVNSSISELEKELAEIAKEKKEIEKSINSAKKEKKSEAAKKQQLDADMNLLQKEIDAKESLIAKYNNQIEVLNNETQKVQNRIDDKMEQYFARARANFEKGTSSYLEMLFSSSDFSQFLVRLDLIESIASADEEFINSLQNDKQNIISMKQTVEESKTAQLLLKNELNAQKKELSYKISESSKIIADLENGINNDKEQLEAADAAFEKANKELEKELAKLATLTAYVGGDFVWPTTGIYKISCKFGSRIHPITKKKSFHYGVDIAAPNSTPIVAANSGKIITATYSSVYGYYVVIDHGGGITTLYAHMTKYTVKNGDTVSIGDKIGYVGSTGWSTGPHLHFEIRENGIAINPLSYYDIKFIYV